MCPKGETLRLSVEVFSNFPVSYKWYKDGIYLPNEINAELILDFSMKEKENLFCNIQRYYVEVINENGLVKSDTSEVVLLDTQGLGVESCASLFLRF